MKVAIVTGSTRGIGKAIAINLAKDGYNVVINYNSSDELALEVKKECDVYNEALIVKCNIASFDDTLSLVNTVMDKFGQIDLLVNNAGITQDGLVMRMSESQFDDVINVNLKGAFNMCKHVSKHMFKQRSGKIINMTSVIGLIGNAGQANYAASKGGVIAMTKSLAKEFAARGITVNAVAPGFIETDMTDKLNEEQKEAIVAHIPLKRIGTSDDVANLVNFLASTNADYITGQIFQVDGGMVI
ncbi:MAG: 3-oxoacyl-[acyl-carrier-protein] reductase [bacterium]